MLSSGTKNSQISNNKIFIWIFDNFLNYYVAIFPNETIAKNKKGVILSWQRNHSSKHPEHNHRKIKLLPFNSVLLLSKRDLETATALFNEVHPNTDDYKWIIDPHGIQYSLLKDNVYNIILNKEIDTQHGFSQEYCSIQTAIRKNQPLTPNSDSTFKIIDAFSCDHNNPKKQKRTRAENNLIDQTTTKKQKISDKKNILWLSEKTLACYIAVYENNEAAGCKYKLILEWINDYKKNFPLSDPILHLMKCENLILFPEDQLKSFILIYNGTHPSKNGCSWSKNDDGLESDSLKYQIYSIIANSIDEESRKKNLSPLFSEVHAKATLHLQELKEKRNKWNTDFIESVYQKNKDSLFTSKDLPAENSSSDDANDSQKIMSIGALLS